jgi:FtsZ-interacting cell division protein YlmF
MWGENHMSLVESVKHFLGFTDEVGFVPQQPIMKKSMPSSKPVVREQRVVSPEFQPRIKPQPKKSELPSGMGIVITEPRGYEEDSRLISSYLKDGHVVLINLKYLDAPTGKRLVDFICGTIYAFEGYVKKLGGNIFLCTPGSINVFDNQQDDVMFNEEQPTPAYAQEYAEENQRAVYQQVG